MKKKLEVSLNDLENLAKELDFPVVENLGDGLYRLPEGIICGEKFLEQYNKEIQKKINNDPSSNH